ncbi:MAG: YigZ family protein, partial [Deltaproteobacteria bacterium]|nr:YigZ family protein [Deltaproteobacteria bacterium]
DGQLIEQARDDGEVGRPGTKILAVMRRYEIEGVLIVSRIFGGVKLGPGNVGRSFARVADEVVLAFKTPSDGRKA